MARRPQVSIIVRSFNEQGHIGRLMQGIFLQSHRDFEVVLVDSGSTDRTVELACRWPVRVVHVQPEEFSFGRSLNLGCEAARGEYLVFISAHCHPVRSTWLAKLVEPLRSPGTAASYGKQRGAPSSRYSERRLFAQWFPDYSVPKQTTPFMNNANAAIRRSLWKTLRFNEELTGLEDLDWARRAMERGYTLAYVAEAEIVHIHQESYRRIYRRYLREGMAMKRIYPEAEFTFRDMLRLWWWNVGADLRQAWREGCWGQQLAGVAAFRLMQFWGTYRGHNLRQGVTEELRRRFYYPAETTRRSVEAEPVPTADGEVINYTPEPSLPGVNLAVKRTQTSLPSGRSGAGPGAPPAYFISLN